MNRFEKAVAYVQYLGSLYPKRVYPDAVFLKQEGHQTDMFNEISYDGIDGQDKSQITSHIQDTRLKHSCLDLPLCEHHEQNR